VINNEISDYITYGSYLYVSEYNTLSGNIVDNNFGISSVGVYLGYYSDHNEITDNTMRRNGYHGI
jgi:parallel beta-helix repeat protein